MTEDALARIKALEGRCGKQERWASEHDGRVNAYWEAQHSRNDTDDVWKITIVARVSAIERRIMWIAGVASAIGALGGSLLSS